MFLEFSPIPTQDTPSVSNSDYPSDPSAAVTISYNYNYKNDWIEAAQDAVEQIIGKLGFKDKDEFNAFFTIYGLSLLVKTPVGYIYNGTKTDRPYVRATGYFIKTSLFSDYLTSSSIVLQNAFYLTDPMDMYMYLFGKVTNNYSEAERFQHIRSWFINKVGIYKYIGTDKRNYDGEADLLAQFTKNKYLTVWNPPRDKKIKLIPPANKASEARSINITAHTKFLIDTFLAAYRNPPAAQNAEQLYQGEQGIISSLLNLPNQIKGAIVDKVSEYVRPVQEFLFTGTAAKSSWKLSTYVDFSIEIPVMTLAKIIEIDAGIWKAKWCVYNESTNEGYIFNANCFTIGAGISLLNSKYGLKYLKKLQQQKVMELVNLLTPRAQQVLKRVLDTNVSLGRADLPTKSDIYETGGPITRDSFNGKLETHSISLSGGNGALSSQSLLIMEEVAQLQPQINPKTGKPLPFPPQTSYLKPKSAILMEGISHNNNMGASFNAQIGFGTCSTGEKIDYRQFLSWFN